MSAVLNTNVASLWASKNLLGAQSKLAGSVERLSSGLRINRARDDAAGLGVANSLTAQINGANQGVRNLNDAISMVQTAEGAIAAASDMGQRILMLATQGANATLGVTERKAIQTEMSQLLSSIDSIGGRTNFSGNDLLGVGTNAVATDSLYSMQISNTASDKVSLTKAAFYNIGYKLDSGLSTESTTFTFSALAASKSVTIGGRTVTAGTGGATAVQVAEVFRTGSVGSIAATAISGVTGTLTGWAASGSAATDATGNVTFTSSTANVDVTDIAATSTDSAFTSTKVTTQGGQGANAQASSLYNQVQALSKMLDDALTTQSSGSMVSSATLTDISNKFQTIQTEANKYVVSLGTQRSLLGAYQNQMEYTLSNITELSSNLQSARSRVIDTDYASETANLTKGQILQQAATAMLAQANQMPNVILTLLK